VFICEQALSDFGHLIDAGKIKLLKINASPDWHYNGRVYSMLRHYFKISWRNLLKDRQFTFLNLVGLSTGLACTLLISLWVKDELQVDQFNKKDKQLFQVMQYSEASHDIVTRENTPGLLAATLAAEMPEVEYATPVIPVSWFDKRGILTIGDQHIEASEQFVGKDFFDVFSYPILQGDKNTVLTGRQSVLISDELARKLFHNRKRHRHNPGMEPEGLQRRLYHFRHF
jgi:hypothetical protein